MLFVDNIWRQTISFYMVLCSYISQIFSFVLSFVLLSLVHAVEHAPQHLEPKGTHHKIHGKKLQAMLRLYLNGKFANETYVCYAYVKLRFVTFLPTFVLQMSILYIVCLIICVYSNIIYDKILCNNNIISFIYSYPNDILKSILLLEYS